MRYRYGELMTFSQSYTSSRYHYSRTNPQLGCHTPSLHHGRMLFIQSAGLDFLAVHGSSLFQVHLHPSEQQTWLHTSYTTHCYAGVHRLQESAFPPSLQAIGENTEQDRSQDRVTRLSKKLLIIIQFLNQILLSILSLNDKDQELNIVTPTTIFSKFWFT